MINEPAMAHGPRLLRQRRAPNHAQLDKRQGRTTTVSVTRVREDDAAAATTTARVRTTATPDAGDDDATTTTTPRGRTTRAPAPAPAPVPATTATTSSVAAIIPVTSVPRIASSPAVLVGTISVTQSASADQANGSTSSGTASKGGLSKGATIGVAVGAAIIGLVLIAFIVSTLWRRRKAKANGGGDYSWTSREKEDLYGPSPSRNVMSDASFGNTQAPNLASAYRPLSEQESRRMLLGGPAPSLRDARNTNNFSEAMFSQPKQQQATYNAPRASFMTGPAAPPSVGALYGKQAAPAAGQSPFDDSAQYAGKIFVVRRTFEPSLADELIIYPGDRIEIITVYDDGWCLGINLDSAKPGQEPQKGVFPRDCVEEMGSQDVPLSQGGDLHRAPTLPPMGFEGQQPPAISISSPGRHNTNGSDSGSHILSRFPNTPARDPLKRTSSLLASGKDAELYKALGDAIDRRDADRRI